MASLLLALPWLLCFEAGAADEQLPRVDRRIPHEQLASVITAFQGQYGGPVMIGAVGVEATMNLRGELRRLDGVPLLVEGLPFAGDADTEMQIAPRRAGLQCGLRLVWEVDDSWWIGEHGDCSGERAVEARESFARAARDQRARREAATVWFRADIPVFHLDANMRSCFEPHRRLLDGGLSLGVGIAGAGEEEGLFIVTAFQVRRTGWGGGIWGSYVSTRITAESSVARRWILPGWQRRGTHETPRRAMPFAELAGGLAYNHELEAEHFGGGFSFAPFGLLALGRQVERERALLQLGAQLCLNLWTVTAGAHADCDPGECCPSYQWTSTGLRGALFVGFLWP